MIQKDTFKAVIISCENCGVVYASRFKKNHCIVCRKSPVIIIKHIDGKKNNLLFARELIKQFYKKAKGDWEKVKDYIEKG